MFAPTIHGPVTLARRRPSTEAEVFSSGRGAWGLVTSIEMPVAVVTGRPEDVGPGAFAPTIAEALQETCRQATGPLEDPGLAADVAGWVRAHA